MTLIITDTATQNRRHMEWGLEGPNTYDSSTSLLIDSDSLVTSGFAGTQTNLGTAYDPNASGNNCIICAVSPQGTAMCGTGNQSHIGPFRVKARVSTNTPSPYVRFRFVWRQGNGPYSANPWVTAPAAIIGTTGDTWYEIDLGIITVDEVVTGTQRWTGRVEVGTPLAAASSMTAGLDYLVLIPLADGYGKASAAYPHLPIGTVVGFEDGTTGGGTGAGLNGATANAGGTWATSGATTDFVQSAPIFTDENGNLSRVLSRSTAVNEATPRFAILGSTNYTNVDVGVEASTINYNGLSLSGKHSTVIARWTNSSNYAFCKLTHSGTLQLGYVLAGVTTTLAQITGAGFYAAPGPPFYTLRIVIYASGLALGYVQDQNGTTKAGCLLAGKSTVLATAGTLATGLPGFADQSTDTQTHERAYRKFYVATPVDEPLVVYSGRSMQVRHDATVSLDSTGTYAGPPPSYKGTRFFLPTGTSRLLVKMRRDNVDASADMNVTDATQIQVAYQARSLVVPRA